MHRAIPGLSAFPLHCTDSRRIANGYYSQFRLISSNRFVSQSCAGPGRVAPQRIRGVLWYHGTGRARSAIRPGDGWARLAAAAYRRL